MPSWSEAQLSGIHDAIRLCFKAAELAHLPDQPRVVPLAKLLDAWPLVVAEVANLTRRSAAAYMSQRSGHQINLEADAEHPLAGFLCAYPYFGEVWGCILVEKSDRIERRRFSAAHELGHYLLHFMPRIKNEIERGEYLSLDENLLRTEETGVQPPHDSLMFAQPSDQPAKISAEDVLPMEHEANRFAAELLVPASACLRIMNDDPAGATPRRMATQFLVSPAAMEYRLRSLGLLPFAGRGNKDT